MARYARAGCYNSEGEFSQTIQKYTLVLHRDEMENTGGFRAEKRRIGMHERVPHSKDLGGLPSLVSAALAVLEICLSPPKICWS
ncbi:hypothetical protein PR003_g25443 [Phytophthora rubi]|uniref:Uncharacterized protein n=1 Tax=Phytophthora rubi TaxID=129364 RepID=A0A6A4CEX6_9STRA|nr:hypothetical protein PR002_g25286 [Phytophthora rubi]KAE9289842.1 hypothetical protein PR003_g25443 [Phytophthora rubi]